MLRVCHILSFRSQDLAVCKISTQEVQKAMKRMDTELKKLTQSLESAQKQKTTSLESSHADRLALEERQTKGEKAIKVTVLVKQLNVGRVEYRSRRI